MGFVPMNPLLTSVTAFYRSSIGKKIVVALTGLAMMGFLVGHLTGNLLVFKGPDAINGYAHWLHTLGWLLWAARLGLLAAVVVHIVATVQLTLQNKAARPEPYGFQATRRASKSSRLMIWSGLTILCFLIYHLMHFTWGISNSYYEPGNPRYSLATGDHNVYNMVIDGFRWIPASLFYILSMGLLCSHLGHGFSSVFQTLGLTTPKTRSTIDLAGNAFAGFIFLGNISIPLAVMFHIIN